MNTPLAVRPESITNLLAYELFKRMSFSVAMGWLGLALMTYAHWNAVARLTLVGWIFYMFVVFASRWVIGRKGLRAAIDASNGIRYVNINAFLCLLTGLGWVSTFYLFDSSVLDQRFNMRLVIIAAAMTFTLSSMASFKRVLFAYILAICLPAMAYFATHDYVRPWEFLLPGAAFYLAMITLSSLSANRSIRKSIRDHLHVLALTDKLQHALDTERRLRDEMSVRAETDEMTGILNRRGLLSHLRTELAKCLRFQWPVAVLMIDIDKFKAINDTYGHSNGDLALRGIVEAIKTQLRETDLLGRLGGEEFLVVLPMLAQDSAIIVAERIREFIAGQEFALTDRSIRLTVSIGIATYIKNDNTDRLLARADDALYVAKHRGRDRVEVSLLDA